MATRSLGSLTLDLVAKVGGFQAGMDQAERALDASSMRMQAKAKALGETIGKSIRIAVIGAAAALSTLGVAVKKSIDNMDSMSKSAQRVGTSTENFSTLAFAAKLSDIQVDQLTKTLGKLYQAEGLAVNASSAQAKVFKGLGIDIKDHNGNLKDSVTLLKEFADKYQKAAGSPAFMAAGMQLFGRQFQNLVPLLKDGSAGIEELQQQAKSLGIEISTGAGQQAELFNDNLNRLGAAVEGIVNAVSVSLLPVLVEWSEKAVAIANDTEKMKSISEKITSTLDSLAVVGHTLAIAFYAIEAAVQVVTIAIAAQIKVYAALFEAMNGAAHLNYAGVKSGLGHAKDAITTAFDAMGDAGKNAKKSIEGSVAAIAAIMNGTGKKLDPKGTARPKGDPGYDADILKGLQTTTKTKDAVDKLTSSYDALAKASYGYQNSLLANDPQFKAEQTFASSVENLTKLKDAYLKAGGSAKLANEMFDKGLAGIKAKFNFDMGEPARQVKEYTDALDDQLLALKQSNDLQLQSASMSSRAASNLAALTRAQQDATKAVTDFVRAHQLHPDAMSEDVYQQQLKALQEYQAARIDLIKQSQANEEKIRSDGFAGMKAGMADFVDKMNDSYGQARNAVDSIANGFSDAFTSFAMGTESAKKAFGDWVDSISAQAIKFLANKAISELFKMLGGGGSGGGADTSQSWFSTLGQAIFGSGKAAGGYVQPHSIQQVNERGAEMLSVGGRDYLMMGARGGKVTPNSSLHSDRQLAITNNFAFAAPTSLTTQTQVAQRTSYEIARARRLS
jgi:lambda family phage tail tape measure protein